MGVLAQVIQPTDRVLNSFSEDWMLFVVFAFLFLLGFVRFRYAKSFSDLFYFVLNLNKLREAMRQELVVVSGASQILLVSSFLNLAMFIYLGIKVFSVGLVLNLNGFLLYFAILVGLVTAYGLKFIFLKLVQQLYGGDFSLNEYNFTVNLYLKVAGVVLIPIVILLAFTSELDAEMLVFTGLFVIISSMLWRYWRGLQNAILSRISYFYIILYLCAFEILPILTMTKMFF